MLEWVSQAGCEVSILSDIQNLAGHRTGQPAVVDPALSRAGVGLHDLMRSPPTSTIP